MKINRKDLESLIITLQTMLNNNQNEILDISKAFNVPKVISEFELPEKWCVEKNNQDVIDWFNKFGKSGSKYRDLEPNVYMHYPVVVDQSNQKVHRCKLIREGYKEITLNQFKEYIFKPYKEQEDNNPF